MISEVRFYKSARGYDVRLEGEDLSTEEAYSSYPDSKRLTQALRKLILRMDVQDIDESMGRPVTKTEADQLREANARANASMDAGPTIAVLRPTVFFEEAAARIRAGRETKFEQDDRPPCLREK